MIKNHDEEKKIDACMLKTPENPPGPTHFLSFAVWKNRFIKYLQSLQCVFYHFSQVMENGVWG